MKNNSNLPYINNFLAISVTVIIAFISVLIFQRHDGITMGVVLQDAAIFGVYFLY